MTQRGIEGNSGADMIRFPLSSSSLRSMAASALRAASLALAVISAAGCGDPAPVKKGANSAIDPAEQARFDQCRKLIDEANRAIADKKYSEARKELTKAKELNVEALRFEIDETFEKLDKKEAKLWSNEVEEGIKGKACLDAVKQLYKPMKELDSDAFDREIRRLVGEPALACIEGAVNEKVGAGAYADARKLLDSDEVKRMLGASGHKKFASETDAAMLESLSTRLAEDLKAKKWDKAMEKIDGFEKKGDATADHVAELVGKVREMLTPDLLSAMSKATGQSDAPSVLKSADAQIKLVRWDPTDAGVAAGKAPPEDVMKKRSALAVWVEAQHVGFKVIKTAEKRFAHGKVAVAPPNDSKAPSKRDIPHGSEVWILGTGKGVALVMDQDPGGAGILQLLDKVAGWAKLDHLVKDNTSEWLVPDDQLKGQRVWGPLRPPETMYELGLVTDVQGRDILVKRLADDQIFKMPRQKLRGAKLSPGTRVITFCTAKDQPAQVMELLPAGRGVKLKCDGGQEKEEVLASLRSKVELLPATK